MTGEGEKRLEIGFNTISHRGLGGESGEPLHVKQRSEVFEDQRKGKGEGRPFKRKIGACGGS